MVVPEHTVAFDHSEEEEVLVDEVFDGVPAVGGVAVFLGLVEEAVGLVVVAEGSLIGKLGTVEALGSRKHKL